MEIQVIGFPNYTITNDGEIFSLNYLGVKGRKQQLIPTNSGRGYVQVQLCKDGKKYVRYPHILVAQHFIPNPDNLPQINHKDGDKSNCHDWNLEWCTQGDNMKHAHNTGLRDDRQHLLEISKMAVEKISKSVLQLNNDGTIHARYKNAVEASDITGAPRRHICSCCNGKRNTCGGWKWSYDGSVIVT